MRKRFPDGIDPRDMRVDPREVEPHVQPHAGGSGGWGLFLLGVLTAACVVGLGVLIWVFRG